MKRKHILSLICFLITGFVFIVSCNNLADEPRYSLADYQAVGTSVFLRDWTEDYDCSNFSVQFYQNCYKAGLPCRVRSGMSGGSMFEIGRHAWNSVKINGKWVNWEPQFNNVYEDHRQTWTPMGGEWGTIYDEDIARMLYEYIGRHVPEPIINLHEIDDSLYNDTPFYPFFVPRAYCLNDDTSAEMQAIMLEVESYMSEHDQVGLFAILDSTYFVFIFKYYNKYYGIEDLQVNDPLEGRSVIEGKSIKELVNSGADFTVLDVDISY